jgi:hypothetical protein
MVVDEATMIDEYIKSFDHVRGVWAKKQEAATFADFLAPELDINRKGVVVEPDGRTYRVRIPLLSCYWHPVDAGDWQRGLNHLKKVKKSCMTEI